MNSNLITLSKYNCKLVTKFRTNNHTLVLERGRYSNMERHLRYCALCNANIIRGEFHLFLECNNNDVSQYRTRFRRQYTNTANMFGFANIMSSISIHTSFVIKLAKYLASV